MSTNFIIGFTDDKHRFIKTVCLTFPLLPLIINKACFLYTEIKQDDEKEVIP